MPTNEIAIDAERLSVQLLKREKRIISRAAVEKGYRSVGDYVRHLLQTGIEIEDQNLAERYRAARATRYSRSLGLCLIGSLVVFQSVFGDFENYRRTPRPSRTKTTQATRASRRHE